MKNLVALKWFKIVFVAIVLNVMIATFSSIGGFTFTPFASANAPGEGGRCPSTTGCTSGGCTTVASGGTCIYFESSCPSPAC